MLCAPLRLELGGRQVAQPRMDTLADVDRIKELTELLIGHIVVYWPKTQSACE